MCDPVVIYGAGGFGGQVLAILQQAGRYRPIAFLDSNPRRHGDVVAGLPVRGGLECVASLREDGVRHVIVAIGDNVTRAAHAETLQAHGMELVSAIHPLASISPSAEVEDHVIIDARATVCVHSRIGRHAVLSAGAICDHDNVIGVGVYLGPAARLAGGVHVGDFASLEIGAAVIPGKKVGEGARVQAGAVVIRDVPPRTTVCGAPARLGGEVASRFVADPRPEIPVTTS